MSNNNPNVGVPTGGTAGGARSIDLNVGNNSGGVVGLPGGGSSGGNEDIPRGRSESDVGLGPPGSGSASRRTRVFWGRGEMDKLLSWIEQNKPDCIGHGRREDCARIKTEVFALRADYTTKTIKEKLLNMEKKFKKAQELKFSRGTSDLSIEGASLDGMFVIIFEHLIPLTNN